MERHRKIFWSVLLASCMCGLTIVLLESSSPASGGGGGRELLDLYDPETFKMANAATHVRAQGSSMNDDDIDKLRVKALVVQMSKTDPLGSMKKVRALQDEAIQKLDSLKEDDKMHTLAPSDSRQEYASKFQAASEKLEQSDEQKKELQEAAEEAQREKNERLAEKLQEAMAHVQESDNAVTEKVRRALRGQGTSDSLVRSVIDD